METKGAIKVGEAVCNSMNRFMKEVRFRMFPITTINQALGIEAITSTRMTSAISVWMRMFSGGAPWLYEKESHAVNLGLPSSIAAELARLTTIENSIEVTGSARANFLSLQLDPVRDSIRSQVEYGVAGGGLVFKPYIDGAGISVDFSHPENFYPTSFDGAGKLSGVVFIEQITRNDKLYRRLEYHHLTPEGCIIENKAYVASSLLGGAAVLGKPISLGQVDEWSRLEPSITIQNVNRLLLGYFKIPLANTIDGHSPLGVSAYSRAEGLIREADAQWDRILWEYEGSELAVHVDPTLFKNDGKGHYELPKGKERLYRTLPGLDNDKKIDWYSPAIRDIPLFNGLNNILKRIEFQCSLAYGTLSDPQNVDKTAEEIRSSKQRSHATVKDIQKALQSAVDDLLYAMDIWTTVGNLSPPGAYAAKYKWDDSIVSDPSTRKQMHWQYVTAGKFPMWRYLMEFEDYSEQDAKALVAETGESSQQNPLGFGGDA